MIISYIIPYAGMGNQMFMYAAGLAAAQRLGTELGFSTYDFYRIPYEERPYALGCFPEVTEHEPSFAKMFRVRPGVALRVLLDTKLDAKHGGFFKKLPGRVARRLFLWADRTYKPSWLSWSPEFLDVKDNTLLCGYFESEKIFADIADLVRKKFTFSPECFDHNLSAMVRTCNSVALHVRRGDKSYLDCYSNGYYLKSAFEKISSMTDNPKFFVLSDDIEWCKKNLPVIYDAEYTFIEGRTPAQDMALITQCKHVIMGPSTFSWWGAWLNDNPNKIIITPDVNLWYKEGTYDPEDRKYLLPPEWIKIS